MGHRSLFIWPRCASAQAFIYNDVQLLFCAPLEEQVINGSNLLVAPSTASAACKCLPSCSSFKVNSVWSLLVMIGCLFT